MDIGNAGRFAAEMLDRDIVPRSLLHEPGRVDVRSAAGF
jgi:hypothetical protein